MSTQVSFYMYLVVSYICGFYLGRHYRGGCGLDGYSLTESRRSCDIQGVCWRGKGPGGLPRRLEVEWSPERGRGSIPRPSANPNEGRILPRRGGD